MKHEAEWIAWATAYVRGLYDEQGMGDRATIEAVEDAFIALFRKDDPAFDADRFRQACGS